LLESGVMTTVDERVSSIGVTSTMLTVKIGSNSCVMMGLLFLTWSVFLFFVNSAGKCCSYVVATFFSPYGYGAGVAGAGVCGLCGQHCTLSGDRGQAGARIGSDWSAARRFGATTRVGSGWREWSAVRRVEAAARVGSGR
jgi:hypothetical protein